MYSAVTQGIRVSVEPHFLEEQSDPARDRYVWAYRVEIENGGEAAVQLVARHWIITDGHGHVEEVRGLGVVGEQPVLQPGERYSYTSGCPLTTPSGIMRGSYQMAAADGALLLVEIPAFSLDLPGNLRVVH
ncbi:MAG TPA: Co2+/Mg2+ efflux protein ApaG [Afifellaceae bacterium]|nr:Co2+/Mg2+ efflux protein ApaG [Afifellaceae bacterium]